MQADVSDPELVAEVFDTLRQQFGRLDILVSNAAVGVLRPALELSLKHWRRCLETNALALNLLAQQAVPLMTGGGRIIALSSLGATRAIPQYAFHWRLERPPWRAWPAAWRRNSVRAASVSTWSRGGGGYRCAQVFFPIVSNCWPSSAAALPPAPR